MSALVAEVRGCCVLLLAAIPAIVGSAADASAQTFVGDDGHRREHSSTYAAGYQPGRSEPHYFRAAVDMTALLAIGTGLYYLKTRDPNHSDYPNVWDRFRTLQPTFDTNTFEINALGHPAAGAMYTLFARTNGLSIPASFVYSAVSSFVWELGLEVHEKPSINDFIITPVAGAPIGEVLVHLGDYFNSTPARPRWYHEVLGFVFGPAHRLHRALDGYKRPTSELPADRLGYSSFYTHRFDLLAGPMHVANSRNDEASGTQLRFNAEVVSIPGFLRPGTFHVNFSEGDFVETLIQVNLGGKASAYDLLCEANLFGRYAQNISEGARSGVASMFAFNSAARFANRNLLDRPDNYFVAHAGGPAVKLWAVHGDFVARFEGSGHLDFALIRALSFPTYAELNGDVRVPSVVVANNYYYGLGASVLARGLLSYKGFELGGRALLGRYDSIDQGDRFGKVSTHVDKTDRIGELEAWIGLTPVDFPLQVRGFFEHLHRSSEMGSMVTNRWDRRSGITIGGRL